MSGEVEGHDLLVGQGFVRGDGGPVETKKVLSGNQIHLFFLTSFAISKIAKQLTLSDSNNLEKILSNLTLLLHFTLAILKYEFSLKLRESLLMLSMRYCF